MLSANEKLDLVKASVRKSKMGTAQEKEDLARIDARYVELNAEYMEAKTFFELMTTLEEAARRDVKFISRIVETKKLELEMGGRGGSLGRPGAGGPNRFSRPRERDR